MLHPNRAPLGWRRTFIDQSASARRSLSGSVVRSASMCPSRLAKLDRYPVASPGSVWLPGRVGGLHLLPLAVGLLALLLRAGVRDLNSIGVDAVALDLCECGRGCEGERCDQGELHSVLLLRIACTRSWPSPGIWQVFELVLSSVMTYCPLCTGPSFTTPNALAGTVFSWSRSGIGQRAWCAPFSDQNCPPALSVTNMPCFRSARSTASEAPLNGDRSKSARRRTRKPI